MKATRNPGRWIVALLAAGLLLALAPATGLAQTLDLVAYEVGEIVTCHLGDETNPIIDLLCASAKITPGKNDDGTRVARATLVGGLPLTVGGSPLPGGLFDASETLLAGVKVDATSVVSLDDLTGPISGKATLYLTDGSVAIGTVSGELDLSQITLGFAPVSGHWRILSGTLKGSGTLSGTALVPFKCAGTTQMPVFCYLAHDPTTGTPTLGGLPVPLAPDEFAGGFPLVKWVLKLVTE